MNDGPNAVDSDRFSPGEGSMPRASMGGWWIVLVSVLLGVLAGAPLVVQSFFPSALNAERLHRLADWTQWGLMSAALGIALGLIWQIVLYRRAGKRAY